MEELAFVGKPVGMSICKKNLEQVLSEDKAKSLIEESKKYGCKIDIKCLECDTALGMKAYFMPVKNEIHLCCNLLYREKEVRDVAVHELMHFYDNCSKRVDFNSCSQLACSEIRASAVSECSDIRFKWPRDYCIRKKAEKSTQLNCPDARKLVAENFKACSIDTHPITLQKR